MTEGEDGYKYASLKFEIDGLKGTVYYQEEDGTWTPISVAGFVQNFTLPEGCTVVVGVYGRDGNRPLAVKNAQIMSGIGIESPVKAAE